LYASNLLSNSALILINPHHSLLTFWRHSSSSTTAGHLSVCQHN